MTERAQFEAELIDGITKPARRGERALDSLERRMRRFDRGQGRAPRRGTGERIAGGGSQRGLGRALKRQTQERERFEKRSASRESRARKKRDNEEKRGREKLTSALSGGLQTVAIAATGAVVAVGALAAKIGLAATDQAEFAQNSELAFDFLAKHGVKGIQIFDHVRGLAERLGLDVEDTTHAYQKFLALQFNPKEADKFIKLGSDLRVLGADAEGVKGIFTAIGQIKSKDKLQAEEMLQLAERGVSQLLIWEEVGKRMGGKTVAEVQKAQAKGQVTWDIAGPAIEAAILRKLGTKEAGEAGQKFADTTISGIIGRIKAKGQNLGVGLGQRIEAGLGRTGGNALERFDKWLQSDDADKAMDRVAERILVVADGIERSIPKIEAFFKGFGAGADEATSKLEPLFELMGGGDADGWRENGRAIGELIVSLAAVGTTAAALAFPLLRVGEAIATSIIEPFASVALRVEDAWENIKAIFDADGMEVGEKAYLIGKEAVRAIGGGMLELIAYPFNVAVRTVDNLLGAFDIGAEVREIGKTIITSLGDGINDFITYPVKKAGEVSDAVVGAFRYVFDSHSPSKVLRFEGGNVSWGLGDGIEDRGEYARDKALDVGHDVGLSMRGGLRAGARGRAGAGMEMGTGTRGLSFGELGLWQSGPAARHDSMGARAEESAPPAFDIGPRTTAGLTPQSVDVGGGGGSASVQFGDVYVGGDGREAADEFMAAVRPQLIEFFEDMELAG